MIDFVFEEHKHLTAAGTRKATSKRGVPAFPFPVVPRASAVWKRRRHPYICSASWRSTLGPWASPRGWVEAGLVAFLATAVTVAWGRVVSPPCLENSRQMRKGICLSDVDALFLSIGVGTFPLWFNANCRQITNKQNQDDNYWLTDMA